MCRRGLLGPGRQGICELVPQQAREIKSAMPLISKCDVYFIERITVRTLLSHAVQKFSSVLEGVAPIKLKFERLQTEVK